MAKRLIDRGTAPNDGTGDNLRAGADKINLNFTELYTAFGDGSTLTAGNFLTDTSTNTLQNKTINLSNNTVTGTTAQFNTALSDNDFATISGTEILSNKDLSGATNVFPTLTIKDDSSTTDAVSLGQTLTIAGGTGLTSVVTANTATINIDSTVATLSDTQTLTNKSISGSDNTLTNIPNSAMAAATISFADDSSTNASISLGGTLTISGGSGISSTISGNEITLNATGITTSELSATAGITNTQLANNSIQIGDDTISLGGTTSSIAGLSLTGSGSINITGNSVLRSAYAGTGNFPTASTYEGAFVYDTIGDKPYVLDGGGAINILTENDSVSRHSDVNISGIADGNVLVWNGSQGRFNAGVPSGSVTFNVEANGSSAYTFQGDGFSSAQDNPTLHLKKGHTYIFDMDASGHPFRIQSTTGTGGTAYNAGVTNNGSATGQIKFIPDMNAPATLYYQCTSHGAMNGTINIT